MTWNAALLEVGGKPGLGPAQGRPPVAFLDELLSLMAPLPDALFAPSPDRNLYDILRPVLGPLGTMPWTDLAERRAAVAVALIVDAGYESTWNWHCGADASAGTETPAQEETGAWQVSADSMGLSPDLRSFIAAKLGTDHPLAFIPAMKLDHALAVEYVIRLFGVSTRWSGPCNENWIQRNLAGARPAMSEWMTAFAAWQPAWMNQPRFSA